LKCFLVFSRLSHAFRPSGSRFASTSTKSASSGRSWMAAAGGLFLSGMAVYQMQQRPTSFFADNLPLFGKAGTNNERTFIAVKPDGVQRGLVGEVIKRFEARGYKLVGIKLLKPSEAIAKEHYIDLKSKPFYSGLVQYFSSGPIVAMVWEGKGVIKGGRLLVGATNPNDSLPGSIRGDLCIDVGRNLIHGSDAPESDQAEISLWFKDGEITSWSQTNESWIV